MRHKRANRNVRLGYVYVAQAKSILKPGYDVQIGCNIAIHDQGCMGELRKARTPYAGLACRAGNLTAINADIITPIAEAAVYRTSGGMNSCLPER